MNYKERSRFYRDLALFSHSGQTLARGLEVMKKGKKGPLLWMMDAIQHHILNGGALWQGMAKFPQYFDDFQVMITQAAEESGRLVDTFRGLVRYYELRHQERRRLLGGLIYPIILLHAAILLPPLKYLFVSNLEKSYWQVVLPPLLIAYGMVVTLGMIWRKSRGSGGLREFVDEGVLKIPIWGKLVRGLSMCRVLQTLSHLHNAGIEPVRAARQAALTAGNSALSWRLNGALPVLEQGGTFSDFFAFAGVLPPMQLGMVTVGEETGMLSDSLDRLVVFIEEDTHHRFSTAVKGMGYFAYFFAAVIAAITIISFYSKYFSI